MKRAVVRSYKAGSVGSNYFECVLICGHTETAYGRRTPGNPVQEAPKTVLCRKCKKSKD